MRRVIWIVLVLAGCAAHRPEPTSNDVFYGRTGGDSVRPISEVPYDYGAGKKP